MIRSSITFRLLSFITIAFIITTLSVLFLANNQLNDIIDTSQSAVYSEKLEAILGTLDRKVQRLRLTGKVEAYEEDFKKSALQTLRQIYYRSANQRIYPVIIGLGGKIVMHPKFSNGDMSIANTEYIKKVLGLKNGEFRYTYENGEGKWIIFRFFKEWDWVIGYTLPLDVKYADARKFRNILILIMGMITFLVLLVLSVIITRFTKPIIRLTKISAEMAKGNLDIPISTSGKDELGVLSRSFVHMRDSIREKILELEQENMERRLAQAEQARLIKIMESTSDMVSTARADSTIMYMNRSGGRMLGWSEDEDVSAKKISDIHPVWAYQKVKKEGIPTAIEYGLWEGETALLGPDGKEIPVSQVIMSHKSPLGEVEYLSTIIRDITERKLAEEALRESEERYRLLVENANEAIFIIEDGIVKFPNPKTEEMTGYSEKELSKFPFIDLIHPEDKDIVLERRRKRLLGEKPVSIYSFRMINKSGGELLVQINTVLITWERKSATINFIRDITEQKRLEAQLQQAQKMEAMGTLAGGIAHDFNNLLMGIQGRTSLMLTDSDASRSYFEHLKGIEDYVKSAADLTKQLLGFAMRGKYEVKTTDLNELIKNQNRMFGRTKKEINIQEKFEENLWTVEVDQGQVEQVLLNIYVNAWQAMPGGGDLYVQSENTIIDENYSKPYLVEPGRYVKISITDTGVGMDEATRQRIFDPFFTTKEMERGTGLGLASAYGIIKNHDGIINVYSEKGEGTTFNIYFPASEKAVIKEQEINEELIRGTETVLLVDDEDMIIEVGQGIIEKLGYKVLIAKSGKEAIEIYEKSQGQIDMVVLDMIMPDMGGGETFDKLKEINPNIKVLLSSGYSINGQATGILERGCNGFIQKPFNIGELSNKIREILDKK